MAKSLGVVSGPLKNAAGLNASLGKLGMKPETAAKFAPTVLEGVGNVGGTQLKSLLAIRAWPSRSRLRAFPIRRWRRWPWCCTWALHFDTQL